MRLYSQKKGEWLLSFGPSSPQTTLNGKNQTANVGSTLDESSLLDRMWAFFVGKDDFAQRIAQKNNDEYQYGAGFVIEGDSLFDRVVRYCKAMKEKDAECISFLQKYENGYFDSMTEAQKKSFIESRGISRFSNVSSKDNLSQSLAASDSSNTSLTSRTSGNTQAGSESTSAPLRAQSNSTTNSSSYNQQSTTHYATNSYTTGVSQNTVGSQQSSASQQSSQAQPNGSFGSSGMITQSGSSLVSGAGNLASVGASSLVSGAQNQIDSLLSGFTNSLSSTLSNAANNLNVTSYALSKQAVIDYIRAKIADSAKADKMVLCVQEV